MNPKTYIQRLISGRPCIFTSICNPLLGRPNYYKGMLMKRIFKWVYVILLLALTALSPVVIISDLITQERLYGESR